MDVGTWLSSLGLERYEQAFRDSDIDAAVLLELTAEDLIGLGISSIGHRRKLLAAIAALRADSVARGVSAAGESRPATENPPSEPSQAGAERRQLTVMFCDLVGSTALASRLDPEDLRELIGAYHRCVADTVGRYDGFVAKYMGDGVLVYFGYPHAHEDDAERAIRAGIELPEAVSRLIADDGTALAVRVGIATGLVVVGDLIGEGAAREQAVVGETPNLAARLQSLAGPNEVVIGPGTQRLVAGLFDLADLGGNELKGFGDEVRAWQVKGDSRVESRFAARSATGLTPLIGRQPELDMLLDRFEQAKDGEGQVVLLSGEPGIGKSRLAHALLERLADEPHTRLRYYCSPYHVNSTLHPIIEQLARAAEFEPDDRPERKLDKLEPLLSQATNDVAAVMPLFAALLSLPAGARYAPLAMPAQRQRELTIAALVDQLGGLAARQPVLMVLEDSQWLDPTSTELFERAIERVQTLPVLLLITSRPEFASPWISYPHMTALTLNRLGRRHSTEMIAAVAGGKPLPEAILAQIWAKTEGVPLFVEELTKTVLEAGLLEDKGDHYELAGPLPPLAIPSTLQDSLMARLDRFAPVKEVAQIGAVIGREFSYRLLAALSPLDETALQEALSQLIGSELAFRRGTLPDATYSFKHAFVQDAAYASLLKSRRQKLHSRIAQTLKERFPQRITVEPEMLAHHHTEAGETDQAIDYWLSAGQRATERSANTEAIAHLERGLNLVKELPEGAERVRRELTLQIALGTPLMATQGYGSADLAKANARARQLCEQVGDAEQLLPVLYRQFAYQVVKSNPRMAFRLAEEFRLAAESQEADGPALAARRCLGFCHYQLGELNAARAQFEWVLAHYAPERHRALAHRYGQDPQAPAQAVLSVVLQLLGYPDQALRSREEAIARAREIDHAATLAYAQAFANCVLSAVRRDWQTVRDQAPALIAFTEEQRITMWHAWAKFFHGWAMSELSPTQADLTKLGEDLAKIDSIGTTNNSTFHLALVAEAHARFGQIAIGLSMIDQALVQVQATDERWWEAEIHRLKGDMLLRQGEENTTEAEALYERAIDIAQGQSAKSLELRAATSLAQALAEQGKRQQAHDLLAPIYGWFTEGFETADLKDAKALLDELRA